ncbi:helix-turn-helix domain-containing protein [Kutzneria chonburiensis]|uniref:Helix-turn-helix domain-containing protein n=1 Tax=Kutzneria chonburiensis TaxID=1483604 RepID=A0ABV6N5L3_9PSEU|nr:helix-turn-helix domain-containing protein [Kutzneria chonburiensis]
MAGKGGRELWTPEDLGTFLQVPEKTLRDWRYKGYGPPWLRMGKRVRYDAKAVLDWLDGLATNNPDAA